MNERLPYEEQLQQQWNDLPLPDENAAWADMKRRLEEDDDDGIVVWWRRGCMLWGLLLLVLIGIGWWIFKSHKWDTDETKKQETVIEQKDSPVDEPNKTTIHGKPSDPEDSKKLNTPGKDSPNRQKENGKSTTIVNDETIGVDKGNKIQGDKKVSKTAIITKTNTGRVEKKSKTKKPLPPVAISDPSGNPQMINQPSVQDPVGITSMTATDSVVKITDPKITTDSVKKKPDIKENTLSDNKAKQDSSKKKKVFFTAGIAMQQLLPVAGQKTVPYNSAGRKGTLADYIPSVYFRVNRKDKWFVQGEFKYGAPQYTKEFVYKQQRKDDTIGTSTFTVRTTNTLKKTYYHQLPVTFNYFIKRDWSIGAGFVLNKFVSAISDQEINVRNNATAADSLVSKGIVQNTTDSSFAKTYFQGVFESQYQWKRFSFGARYAFGLQPYITFTLPGGTQQKEKSTTLQIFVRYQLWKSKK